MNSLDTSLSKSKHCSDSPWSEPASPFLSHLTFSIATGFQENQNVIILKGRWATKLSQPIQRQCSVLLKSDILQSTKTTAGYQATENPYRQPHFLTFRPWPRDECGLFISLPCLSSAVKRLNNLLKGDKIRTSHICHHQ